MAWLVDGNNLLHATPGFHRPPFDRERFMAWLLQHKLPAPCTVVFDGAPPGTLPRERTRRGKVRVVYAGSRTADDFILDRIRPGDTVVTADRELALRCRDRRGRSMGPRAFLDRLAERAPEGDEKPAPDPGGVSEWLDAFGGEEE